MKLKFITKHTSKPFVTGIRQKTINTLFLCVALCLSGIVGTGCSENTGPNTSNKTERNAIKAGNKAYHKREFSEAMEDYNRALESNPFSEVAKLNLAMATLLNNETDSMQRNVADSLLTSLSRAAENPEVSENALYTRANFAVYIGDELQNQANAMQMGGAQQSAQQGPSAADYYKQAIEDYKELLRRKPGDLKVTQNLRITQLKLPPDQQNQNQQNPDNQQNQENQDNQDQNENKESPAPQQQQQPQADALNALEKREIQTRKKQAAPVRNERPTTDKPW